MSESKHTPGPWRLEQDTTLVWGSCNPDDTSDRGMGYPIAECRITPVSHLWAKGPDYGEGEANARLIAAAPDMLEALIALTTTAVPYGEAIELARTAISKAQGGAE